MTDDQQQIDLPESAAPPLDDARKERREFFRSALGAVGVTAAGVAGLSIATSASAATIADNDVMNFLLQLEYLVAQYYSFATTGTGLPAGQLTGNVGTTAAAGTPGDATGGLRVTFTDAALSSYATEIAQDLAEHVTYLRTLLDTGTTAQPTIDLGTTATGAFSTVAQGAGIVASGASFSPYDSENDFLLGAFIFEDVIVTAYKGSAATITDKTVLASAMGLMATHAHHAAVIRSLLYARGVATPSLRTNVDGISNLRDVLDGTAGDTTADDATKGTDQGVSPFTINSQLVANIVPTGLDGIAYGRTNGAVLNIVFLNSAAVSKGGFYPNGLNGNITTSNAN